MFVDTRDRITGTSCDFRIQLPETLVLPPGHRARIDNLRVPQVFPTIQAGVNDTIIVQHSQAPYTATVAKGTTLALGWRRPFRRLCRHMGPGLALTMLPTLP